VGNVEVSLPAAGEQAGHDLSTSPCSALVDDVVERLDPLGGLRRIDVVAVGCVRILCVHSHGVAPFMRAT
jgi:hypothetical protein